MGLAGALFPIKMAAKKDRSSAMAVHLRICRSSEPNVRLNVKDLHVVPFGGAKGTRTLDLYNASVALFQLSYRPAQRPKLGTLAGSNYVDVATLIVALFELD